MSSANAVTSVTSEEIAPKKEPVKQQKQITQIKRDDEIKALLKKIYQKHTLLTISIGSRDSYYGSTILEINHDNNYLVLDELYPQDGHELLETETPIIINTQYAGAFVRFKTRIDAIGGNDKAAYYRIPIPDSIDYHQRRNTFRVNTSIAETIPVNLVTEDEVMIKAELRDISLGGVSLRVREIPHVDLETDQHIPTCLIQLNEDKKILASLDICHIEQMSETGTLRIGGRFSSISKFDLRELEQLIAETERAIIKKIKRSDV